MTERLTRRALPALLFVAAGLAVAVWSDAWAFGAAAGPAAQPEAAEWAQETLAAMSLEAKVGQLICPDITASYVADDDPNMRRWLELAGEHGVGMFVLYNGTPRDTAHILNRLQEAADIPILMAADFEGGPGQQISGASEYPANMAFAAIGDEDLMYRAAVAGGREGRAMGIHLTYTPVVDIAWHPDNPAESVRSFGGDLDLLGRMVRAYVRGYHDSGMLTTAKHYPGRGDVRAMPDNPPWQWIDKTREQVEAQEFAAFRHAIDAGVDFVMSEHIAIPSITGGSTLPASVERQLAHDWLRERLGFEGILTTDDLWYPHVVERFGAEEVALRAFEAGHDIILKPADPVAVIEAMLDAVRSGRITESRIDESVLKLLTLKAQLGLHERRTVDVAAVSSVVSQPEHQALVREVADRSITLLRNGASLPVDEGRVRAAININVQKGAVDPSPPALDAQLAARFPGIRSFTLRPDTGEDARLRILQTAGQADLVIVSLFVPRDRLGNATPIREADRHLIAQLMEARPDDVVVMSYGNPHLIRALPAAGTFLVGYGERSWFGNQPVYFGSFMRALTGEISPAGRLPLHVSDEYPMGAGASY